MANGTRDVQLLQASVDEEGESEFRVLVNKRFVKYIAIDGGLFDPDDMCFGPTFISLLPPLPAGDWNEGRVSRDPNTGAAYFSSHSKTDLPGVTNSWHLTQIDHLELRMGQILRSNVYEATCPRFNSVFIAKFARFPWEIEGHDVRPAFLGHLTEEGRTIGFLMARIPDCRHATPEDLPLCRTTLSRLHQLGIKRGDLNKHNFLVRDGKAVLIDFDTASRQASDDELEDELNNLQSQLDDTSGRGGRVVESGQDGC